MIFVDFNFPQLTNDRRSKFYFFDRLKKKIVFFFFLYTIRPTLKDIPARALRPKIRSRQTIAEHLFENRVT